MNHSGKKFGFTLLYAVLVVSALMSLVFAILNIVYKQIALSSISKSSQIAFYAADSGAECAKYWSVFGAFSSLTTGITAIDCEGRVFPKLGDTCVLSDSNTSACNVASISAGSSQNITDACSGDTCDVNTFNYSPSYGYTGLSPDTNIYVSQAWSAAAAGIASSTIVVTGHNTGNTSDPARVERALGINEDATECLASSFTSSQCQTSGICDTYNTRPSGINPSPNYYPLDQIFAKYMPGEALSDLDSSIPDFDNKTQFGNAPYLLYSPDYFTFTPQANIFNDTQSSVSVALGVSAGQPIFNPSSSDPSEPEYQFGYYTQTGGTADPTTFVSLLNFDSTHIPTGFSALQALPTSTPIYFALNVIDENTLNQASFWSMNSSDDTSSAGWDGYPHVMILAQNSPVGGSGRYIFAFDTDATLSSPAYNNIVIILRLVGCP
jgi:hypothetical protein